jgi:predicted Zn-dependent protease
MSLWKTTFDHVVDALLPQLYETETLKLSLIAESSHFTRFNRAQVRQTGSIESGELTLTLMAQQRSTTAVVPFTGSKEVDWPALMKALTGLREELPHLPEDPYLVLPTGTAHSREVHPGAILPPAAVTPALMPLLDGLDVAGLYAGGRASRAYADSAGQRHWFETATFTLDYSLFTATGQAVKGTYAGREWDAEAYQENLAASKSLLEQMACPSKLVERGHYRTYFAPAAVAELLSMLSWGGISEAAIRRGGSPLAALQRQEKVLSPKFSLTEDFSKGQVPRFNEEGELAPLSLPLIVTGELANTLVSTRTAKEYNIPSNFAASGEYLRAPTLAPGTLQQQEVLAALDTGLYLSNLHYLNWSDRPNGRITGMTRYACFWVEQGQIIAPIENLRFDDSLYNFWGEQLVDLTQEVTFIPEVGSYGYRDLGGTSVPGLLVNNFAYTL